MLLHIGLLLAIIYFVLGLKKPRIALITMPIICGVFIFIVFAQDNAVVTFEALFAIVAVILATLLSVLLRSLLRTPERRPLTWARWLLFTFAFLFLEITGFYVLVHVPSFGFPLDVLFFKALFTIVAVIIATLLSVLLWALRRTPERRPLTWAKWLLFIFAFLFLEIIGFCVLVDVPSFGFPLMILFVATVALIGVAINCGLTSRHATATYVVSTIGASMRQNLPLPMALQSAAAGQDDKRARILLQISRWLVQGYPVAEAIKRGFPKCPSYAAAMISAAERINQLPQAFASIEADMATKSEESRKIEPVTPFYPLILVTAAGFIVWGIMTFVIPPWSEVLTEMTDGARFPAATRALIRIVSFIGWENGALFLIALAFTVLIVIPYSIYIRFRQRRPNDPYTSSRIGDFLKWHLPVLRSFEKNSSVLHVAEMLRLSLNAGATVNDAISNALSLDLNNCFRKRLQAWLEKVEAGENISAAAKKSGVGSSLAWAFDDKANQGNTPAILETVESLHRSSYNYRANLVRFIVSPCVTLIMGAFVGFVVYAVFSAPISIIHYAAEAIYP